jgi:hypothetical protein
LSINLSVIYQFTMKGTNATITAAPLPAMHAIRGANATPLNTTRAFLAKRSVSVSRFRGNSASAPRASLLDFLSDPVKAAGTTLRGGTRATELVRELLEVTIPTEGGIKASPAVRDRVEELVEQLSAYCPRAPLRSELIFGIWEVVYASKPTTAGGPFRSPLGRAIFPGQRALQIIERPATVINEVSYNALGFVPGAARQVGELEPLDERTFQILFPKLDGKRKGGPPKRVIRTEYLGKEVRVGRFIPENEDDEGSFYVFKRVEQEEEEEDQVVVQQQQKQQKPAVWFQQPKSVYADEETDPEPLVGRGRRATGTVAVQKAAPAKTTAKISREATSARAAARAGAATKVSQAEERQRAKTMDEQRRRARLEAEGGRREAASAASVGRKRQEEERRHATEEANTVRAARAASVQDARNQAKELSAAAVEAAAEARDAAKAWK